MLDLEGKFLETGKISSRFIGKSMVDKIVLAKPGRLVAMNCVAANNFCAGTTIQNLIPQDYSFKCKTSWAATLP